MKKSTAKDNVVRFQHRLQERLQAILDAMPIAVSWANLEDQKIVFINKKFADMFGYRLGDHATVGDWIARAYVNPEHVQRAQAMWLHHFGLLTTEPAEIPQVEVDVLCRDGSVKTTLLGGVIVPDAGWALATFVDISDRKATENRVQQLALEDPLTGLPNRRAFDEVMKASIARARRNGLGTALLLIDLDGFKPLNDTLGHDQGDTVLQSVADRLKLAVRGGDFVCRFGGDEFGVIVDGIGSERTAEAVADRVIVEVGRILAQPAQQLRLGASVGIAIYPANGEDEPTLYRNADQALYRAKNGGRNRWSR